MCEFGEELIEFLLAVGELGAAVVVDAEEGEDGVDY